MRLRTFGSLALEGAAFRRHKPLVLLAYLALEGAKPRREVAELFWLGASHPLGNLSVALSQLRKVDAGLFDADDLKVAATLECDAVELLAALEAGAPERALECYQGRFLDGVQLQNCGIELEEWIYQTREFLAERVREAMLQLAERDAAAGRFAEAARLAERAYRLPGAAEPGPEALERLLALLVAGSSPAANEVRREAASFGLSLESTPEQARARLAASSPLPATGPAGYSAAADARRRHNLPAVPPLVGRELELAELATKLSRPDCRLLTLTGIGGIGKTRLALRAAQEQLEAPPDGDENAGTEGGRYQGVFFIPLEALTRPAQVPGAIADALGLDLDERADPYPQIADVIGERSLLLVLDNFEHLLPGAAELPRQLAQLLARCPRLGLLVTSRERLDLHDEWVVPVEGLAFPRDRALAAADAARFDAVQLFVRRAKRVQPSFELDDESLAAVLEICELVEGSPLGLELAAAWTKVLPPAEIAREIAQNLDFLSRSPRDAAERQQSIRATFEYSWQLLDADEQQALASLAVFRGGFLRQAAAEVAGVSIPLLASLLDKSLLRLGERGRYQRHPLLYQFMTEKLAARPEREAAMREAHARYYQRFVLEHAGELRRRESPAVLAAIEADFENIRAAWSWALQRGWFEALEQLAGPLRAFCDVRGKLQIGEELFREAIDSLRPKESVLGGHGGNGENGEHEAASFQAVLGHAYVGAAYFGLRLGATERAGDDARRGLELLRRAQQPIGMATALRTLAVAAHRAGDFAAAKAYIEESLTIADELNDPNQRQVSLKHLAVLEKTLEAYDAALEHNLEALELARRQGHRGSEASILSNLGSLYITMDRPQQAREPLEKGLELARELGYEQLLPFLLSNLAIVSQMLGDYAAARSYCREALPMTRQHGEKALEAGLLISLAMAEAGLGESGLGQGTKALERAHAHLTASLRISWAIHDLPLLLEGLAVVASLGAQHGDAHAAELAALVAGHPATLKGSRELAEQVLAGVPAKERKRLTAEQPRDPEALRAQLEAWVTRLLDAPLAAPETT